MMHGVRLRGWHKPFRRSERVEADGHPVMKYIMPRDLSRERRCLRDRRRRSKFTSNPPRARRSSASSVNRFSTPAAVVPSVRRRARTLPRRTDPATLNADVNTAREHLGHEKKPRRSAELDLRASSGGRHGGIQRGRSGNTSSFRSRRRHAVEDPAAPHVVPGADREPAFVRQNHAVPQHQRCKRSLTSWASTNARPSRKARVFAAVPPSDRGAAAIRRTRRVSAGDAVACFASALDRVLVRS